MLPSEFFVLSWLQIPLADSHALPTLYVLPPLNGHIPHSPMVGSWRPGLRPPLAEAKKKKRKKKKIAISTRCASHLWVSKVQHVPCIPLILAASWEADECVTTTYMRRFAEGATCSHKHSRDAYRMQALQVRCNHLKKQSSELPGTCPEHRLPSKLAGCMPCCDR